MKVCIGPSGELLCLKHNKIYAVHVLQQFMTTLSMVLLYSLQRPRTEQRNLSRSSLPRMLPSARRLQNVLRKLS